MKDRGSALMTAVISIMILVSISGVFFTMVTSHTKVQSSEEKGLTTYYLAEAGVQYGIAKVLDGNIKKGDPLPEPETVNDPFGQGGSFKVQWQDSEDGPSFIVTSTGTYLGIIRKKTAESKYGDDNDDDNDDNPGDDATTDHTSRTFVIADVYPYPGQDYQIPDKRVGSKYNIYIYIVNNGGHEKDNTSASNVKLTMIDETQSITVDVVTTSISEGVGYAVIEDLTYDREARVHFHVEGDIYKNKNHEIFAKANSNSFNIKNPPPVPEPSNRLIWEKEIVDE